MQPDRFPDFPIAEYTRRRQKLTEKMIEAGVDAAIFTMRDNLIYFTGYRSSNMGMNYSPSKSRSFIAIFPREGEPVMIVADLERDGCIQTSWIKNVRAYGSFLNSEAPDGVSLLIKILKEMGLQSKTLGMELGAGTRLWMSQLDFQRFKNELPEGKLFDMSQTIYKVRMVKSEEEIARLRKVCEITEKAIGAGWDVLREGITERKVAQAVQMKMIEEGADRMAFLVIRSGFAKLNMLNAQPTDYQLKKGDAVVLDVGAVYRDYCGDLTRNAILGAPSEEAKKVYGVVVGAQKAAIDAIRPGVKAGDIDRAAGDFLKKSGYEKWMLHRTGHSIGLEVHEYPSLAASDNTILEPGIVLTVEPGLYPLMHEGRLGNFMVEDMILVTKNGYENLCKSSTDLVVKG